MVKQNAYLSSQLSKQLKAYSGKLTMSKIFDYKIKTEQHDYLAPDKSEIRLIVEGTKGNCAHCVLPTGKTSLAIKHKTVEEIWCILLGQVEMWQKSSHEERIVELKEGVGLTIPNGNHFQFRNTGADPLCILLVTMPPWPGKDEAVFVEGY